MAGGTPGPRGKAELLAILARIPRGRVATHGLIARELGITRPHIVHLMASLDDSERETVPWHRVVADGGAIGRHQHRDEQIARLRAEGMSVAPAGIVDEMATRRLTDLTSPAAPIDTAPAGAPMRRSRGMKDRP